MLDHIGVEAMQKTLEYPEPLSAKYQPETIAGFIGLDKPKKILEQFLAKPYVSTWLFLGPSGVGKTTIALALAKQLPAELHHVRSRECDLEMVKELARKCYYVPWDAKFHMVLVDEADQMTHAAQLAFLSILDATAFPPNTIFIFTANSTDLLERRFLSRCRTIEFQTYNIGQALPRYLAQVWRKETGRKNGVNFARIGEEAEYNVRNALMKLEIEILGGGIPDEPREPKAQPKATSGSARARKAWETRRRRMEEKAA